MNSVKVIKKHYTSVLATLLFLVFNNTFAAVNGRLRISDNHRYLQFENGKPFFYLGDTAWELFHRLDREEAERYLTNRAQKGFQRGEGESIGFQSSRCEI